MKPIFLPFPQSKSRLAHERFTVLGWQATFDPQIRRYKPKMKKGGRKDRELERVLREKIVSQVKAKRKLSTLNEK